MRINLFFKNYAKNKTTIFAKNNFIYFQINNYKKLNFLFTYEDNND